MARSGRSAGGPSGVASVGVSWVDEQGVSRQGLVKVVASGIPLGWVVELLAAGATGAGITVVTDQVETAQAPQVVTRPAGEQQAREQRPGRVRLRTVGEKGRADG